MIVKNVDEIKGEKLTGSQLKNTLMKVLVSQEEGWDDYVMRVVEVEKDGYTPLHSHPWIHINYVLEGKGEILIDKVINKVQSGSFAQIPINTIHQFKNTGDKVFKFICIVPKEGHISYK